MNKEKTYSKTSITHSMRKLSFMKTLKERIASAIGLAFTVASLWILLSPIQTFAATIITTANINAGSGSGWNSSDNITAPDYNYSFQSMYNSQSAYLKGTNYDFSTIPEGAVIESIKVTINRYADFKNDNYVRDYSVYLVNKQGVISSNKKKQITNWPSTASIATYTWSKSELDTATLTIADIKDINFGVSLSVRASNAGQTATAYVDCMQIAVTYTMPPILSAITIASNNDNKLMAKEGDKVTLSFTASEAIKTPTVTIAGHEVVPTNVSSNAWKAEYIMTSSDAEGKVSFNIAFSDSAGNAGIPVTTTTDSSSVEYDKTKPVITINGAATVTVGVGTNYTDVGASASDSHDGIITDKIINNGTVDTSKAGSYTLTYDVTDTSGNKALQVTRLVNVVALPTISLDANLIKVNVNEKYGKMYFLSTAKITEGFKLVECGVVMSLDISPGLDINNKQSILSAPHQSSAGQFYSVFNVTYDRTINVRSYITYEDASGVKNTAYSNIVTSKIIKQ